MKTLNSKLQLLIFNFALLIGFLPLTFNFEFLTFNLSIAHAGLIFNRPILLGLQEGLVGSWSFNGPDMAGVTAYDRSGQGNNGTLTNGPVRSAGRIGQALEFDGSNDYVDGGSPSSLDDLGVISVSSWIYSRAGTGEVVNKRGGSGSGWRVAAVATNAVDVTVDYGTTDLARISANGALTPNAWQHVMITWDGSTTASNVRIYVNGVETSYQTTTNGAGTRSSDAAQSLAVGAISDGTSAFSGFIDDVRIYNRVLSTDEIKRLYRMGATLKLGVSRSNDSLQEGLVGSWSFNGPDMAGVTAYDRSGQGNNGTLTNGPVRVAGRIGQALEFDGSDDYVSRTDSLSSLQITGDVSFGGWVNATIGSADGIISINGGADETEAQNILYSLRWITTSGNDLQYIHEFGAGTNESSTFDVNLNSDTWYHLMVVRNVVTNNVVLYVDGSQAGATFAYTDDPTGGTSAPFEIGRALSITTDGLIDDVRVYNRVLTSDEIKRLYRMGATLKLGVSRSNDSLQEGLVGSWSFNGPDMAQSTNNVWALDRSGQGNNGRLQNTATSSVRVAGRIGQALEFDGSNDVVNVGSGTSLDDLGPMSISAWIYPRSLGEAGVGRIVQKSSDLASENGWGFMIIGTRDFDFLVDYTTTNLRRNTGLAFTFNTWQHVLVTWDGSATASNVRIYQNGVEVSSYDTTTDGVGSRKSDAAQTFMIGNESTGARTFDGFIDEVRFYNRVLSPDEIKRLYTIGR